MPTQDLDKENSLEKLLKQANAYKNTLAFFFLATICPEIKRTTNELLEDYTTVLRLHQEQDPNNPKIDTAHALSELAQQSKKCIATHPDLTNFYSLQPSRDDVLFKPVTNYYDLWKKGRQRA